MKNLSDTSERELVITRVVDAPRELVWEAWTDPAQIAKWWGPQGFSTTTEVMEVQPGGVWNHVMHGPDGVEYPNQCIFIEVVKPERIVYSHGGGRAGSPGVKSEVTWTFDMVEVNRTRVTIRMLFSSTADRDKVVREYGAIKGGEQTLGRLAERLAALPRDP